MFYLSGRAPNPEKGSSTLEKSLVRIWTQLTCHSSTSVTFSMVISDECDKPSACESLGIRVVTSGSCFLINLTCIISIVNNMLLLLLLPNSSF